MHRSLTHFWQLNLAVVAGVAITTAVLTGALLVGDSLRGSLRALTLDRLGKIDFALLADRFAPSDLATRLADHPLLREQSVMVAPVTLLEGSTTHVDSGLRAADVQVLGIDRDFADLYPDNAGSSDLDFTRSPGQVFPSVIINAALATEVGAQPGDDLVLTLGKPTAVPRASLMGRRDPAELLLSLRATVSAILPDSGPGRFGLEARQHRPLNLFVDLATLQRRLERTDQANLLLFHQRSANGLGSLAADTLHQALTESLTLADLGIVSSVIDGQLAVESIELVLRPELVRAIDRFAATTAVPTWRYLVYLANTMQVGDRTLPYSTVAALELPVPTPVGELAAVDGRDVGELAAGRIALNSWAASDLQVTGGETLTMTYFTVDDTDELTTATATFEVGETLAMRSLGADASLTPEVPGVSDAADMAAWDPPFPIDLALIRDEDEAYWDEFRGAPKAFLTLAAGQELWRNRYGAITAVRMLPTLTVDLERLQENLAHRLPQSVAPGAVGIQWIPVREQGLRAASGTTDFSGLFIGFSLFLIASAAILVSLLFSLLVERRSREAGLLLALGWPAKAVRRRFLREGAILTLLGVLIGTGLSLLYTHFVLRGLAVWWSPIMDAPILELHAHPGTALLGGLLATALALVAVGRGVRRLRQLPARQLLAGSVTQEPTSRGHHRAAFVGTMSIALALALFGLALAFGIEEVPGLFFGIGAALVAGGLALFVVWCRRPTSSARWSAPPVLLRMAARNSSRNVGRSLLSVTLVACASFVLVSVSASRKTHHHVSHLRTSGTGGFSLVAESDTPLPGTLEKLIGPITGSGDRSWGNDSRFYSLRLRPGDDASCLNLYQPEEPRILGVPTDLQARGGFTFRQTIRETTDPWSLLDDELEDGAIPVIGDYNSVRWILHSGVGREILIEVGTAEPLLLRVVGLLDSSIFQSELLISEKNFLLSFPDQSGYGFFLGEVPSSTIAATRQRLEQELGRFGLDVESAAARLARYQAIENMYLTTFEILGGLGLLLGTVGLGIVLLRNTLERRGELAACRALGFRRRTLAAMVVAENAFLLILGLIIGGGAGLLAVAPYLSTGSAQVPWLSLVAILLAVIAVGLLASIAAVRSSLRVPLLPALKAD